MTVTVSLIVSFSFTVTVTVTAGGVLLTWAGGSGALLLMGALVAKGKEGAGSSSVMGTITMGVLEGFWGDAGGGLLGPSEAGGPTGRVTEAGGLTVRIAVTVLLVTDLMVVRVTGSSVGGLIVTVTTRVTVGSTVSVTTEAVLVSEVAGLVA